MQDRRYRNLRSWRADVAALPGIAVSLLPVGGCPACWPVYAGILSALGLGFLLSSAYLLPLTAAFLAASLFALAWRAGSRRGYGPFVAGLLASLLIIAGKFALESGSALYAGLGLLVAASVWNGLPRRGEMPTCPRCAAGPMPPNGKEKA